MLRLHPTVISACQAQRANGERARQIVEKMRSLCSDMNTDSIRLDDELEISFG